VSGAKVKTVPPAGPRVSLRSEAPETRASANSKLLLRGDLPTSLVEQYRRLAASLHDLQLEKGLKALVVTSALPQEGKTLTTINLALTLSESYARRVLLIDADLRQPAVHEMLGLENQAGLSEALSSNAATLPIVEYSSRLNVVTAGRWNDNPLAVLSSERLRTLLEHCSSSYDWVLLDAPPVASLADAPLVGRLTGAIVFVIRAGVTPYAAVERAIAELGRESIIGTVLNGVSENQLPVSQYG
jgi:capsular exopolysaccharide synthesis family protein